MYSTTQQIISRANHLQFLLIYNIADKTSIYKYWIDNPTCNNFSSLI